MSRALLFVAAAIVPVLLCAHEAWRLGPFQLRWDGRGWSYEPLSRRRSGDGTSLTSVHVAGSGDLRVVLDLGGWMLLRWQAFGGGAAIWLPIQKGDIAARWHAFRCAVYSPRPQKAQPILPTPNAATLDLMP